MLPRRCRVLLWSWLLLATEHCLPGNVATDGAGEYGVCVFELKVKIGGRNNVTLKFQTSAWRDIAEMQYHCFARPFVPAVFK
ncbi:hypothetical protein CLAFUW4_20007 [Fulvia fulva]|uniref:uncharacterized protein n=1 Tax=Passalora fulva TaxID=5499 RepID=UPI002852A699|nr:uncharacterized protein CLAFUR5_20007 [Fulvia fulva]KAK4636304.1 hypothetical protein CLAFUR4_20007 [Fulvia fulva]KAK4637210.1 hypothetical protein CLAFUR0_20007 [Fulvia fulva]WMI38758.1 hypothetical protein CLAFUR5_20007 [Fulvia fulva]WPV08512.1 hypothetical protein CLAFUW4_20007 [Fulvia fulva]WPV25077.1 hypothetical protein CLAFUW7_20007 [Fulvia fulva]